MRIAPHRLTICGGRIVPNRLIVARTTRRCLFISEQPDVGSAL
jgi:hypothetical protein